MGRSGGVELLGACNHNIPRGARQLQGEALGPMCAVDLSDDSLVLGFVAEVEHACTAIFVQLEQVFLILLRYAISSPHTGQVMRNQLVGLLADGDVELREIEYLPGQ